MRNTALMLRVLYAGPPALLFGGELIFGPLEDGRVDWGTVWLSASLLGLAAIPHRFLVARIPLLVSVFLISLIPVGVAVYRFFTLHANLFLKTGVGAAVLLLLLLPVSLILSLYAERIAKRSLPPKI